MAGVGEVNPNAPRLGPDDGGGIRPAPRSGGDDGMMLEVPARPGMSPKEALEEARRLPDFEVDEDFEPVPMGEGTEKATYIVRGKVAGGGELPRPGSPKIVNVWRDTPIAPFGPPSDD
ncbi:MAG TPA: hypothetical protein VJ653_03135 [Acidimicrobiales bacterium]|nr:hypothetical protein [Acidimicrobiales bacterium]